jgi:hypothetical protein
MLAVTALVIGIVATVSRYRHSDQFPWWEWLVGPIAPLGALLLGGILLISLGLVLDRFGLLYPPCRPSLTVDERAWEAVRRHLLKGVGRRWRLTRLVRRLGRLGFFLRLLPGVRPVQAIFILEHDADDYPRSLCEGTVRRAWVQDDDGTDLSCISPLRRTDKSSHEKWKGPPVGPSCPTPWFAAFEAGKFDFPARGQLNKAHPTRFVQEGNRKNGKRVERDTCGDTANR